MLDEVLAAHGGRDRFEQASEIVARIHGSGTAVRTKRFGRIPGDVEVACSTREQRTVFSPYPRLGRRGVFARTQVRIESDDGEPVAQRADPRGRFPGGRRQLWWDDLDFLYFAGYAMWGYLCAPFVFAWPGAQTREIDPWEQDGEVWRRLEVVYPPELEVHSRRQVYYFDAEGMLRRNDYTAEVFGSWAKAAHMSGDPREFGGLIFPTRRRVYPRRRDGRPRPLPTLVRIDVAEVEVR